MDIAPETVGRLRRAHANIVGIKETTRNFKHVSYILNEAGTDFIALSGIELLCYPMLCLGGAGHLSYISNSGRARSPSSTTRSSPAITRGPAPCTTTCTRWSMRPSPKRTPCRRSGSWSSLECWHAAWLASRFAPLERRRSHSA